MLTNRYRLAGLGTALALLAAVVLPGSAAAGSQAVTTPVVAAPGAPGGAGSQPLAVPGALGAASAGTGVAGIGSAAAGSGGNGPVGVGVGSGGPGPGAGRGDGPGAPGAEVAPPRPKAGSVLLADEETGQVLFERASRQPRAMASTTKVMTALLSLERLDQRRTVVIGAEPTTVGEESLELGRGERLTVHQLLLGLLVKSANDAAVALADAVDGSEAAFVRRMNRRAAELGLRATHYVTPYGLDRPGHQTSARDLARLWEVAMRRADFRALVSTRGARLPGPPRERRFTNTNQLLGSYAWTVGGKTGFTDDAGRCLVASASRGGRSLVAVALGSTDAFADVRALFEYGFTAFDWVRLAQRGQAVRLAGAAGGTHAYQVTADVAALVRRDLLDGLALAPPARLVAVPSAPPATASGAPARPPWPVLVRPGGGSPRAPVAPSPPSTAATVAAQPRPTPGATLTVWFQAGGRRLAPLRLGPPGSVPVAGLGTSGAVVATSGLGQAIPPMSRLSAGLVPPGSAPATIDPFLRRASP